MSDFDESLKLMKQIHDSKVQDYAEPGNRMSNFDVQEYISKLFKNDRDKVFATMIGVKIARLGVLLSKEGKPNNESIQDTFIDLANYTLIWKEDYVGRLPKFPIEPDMTYSSAQFITTTSNKR